DLDRALERPGRDDLHALDAPTDQPRRLQRLERDVAFDLRELVHAHLVPRRRLPRPEADLRQPTLQRHLAALEADLVISAGAGVLTLRAAARGLALPGAAAAADARPLLAAALGGFQRVQAHVKLPPRARVIGPCGSSRGSRACPRRLRSGGGAASRGPRGIPRAPASCRTGSSAASP